MRRAYTCLSILFILILLPFSLAGCSPSTTSHPPTVKQGVLDLRDWDLEQKGTVSLNGEWQFYWRQLRDTPDSIPSHFITVPYVWNGYEWNGQKLPGEGYATYIATIRLNPADKDKLLAFYVPDVYTAYRLLLNGKQISENGVVGTSKQTMKPYYMPRLVYFRPETDTLVLTMQISNFVHKNGGMWNEMLIGDAQTLADWKEHSIVVQALIIASLFILGVYHLTIYAIRRKDLSSFYFGLFSFMLSIRATMQENMFLFQLFPNFNWELSKKIEYIILFLGLAVLCLLIQSLYPQEIKKRTVQIIQIICSFFACIAIVTPASIYTRVASIHYIFMLITIVYLMYVLILAVIRKRPFSYINCFVAIFFMITVALDILYYNQIIPYGNFTTFGLLIFTSVQSINLSITFARGFSRIEQMTEELKELNETLELRVQERTQSLEHSLREVARARAEMSIMEERSRIAGDIHDIVGHTLTTTVIQIEAGKRLLSKDLPRALEKLELSQELVRNGLNEIRRAIRIDQEDEEQFIFPGVLYHLVAETEKHTGVKIDTVIEPLPSLTLPQKKFIYHTLKEGLTNGIRHGQSNHFIFTMERRGAMLHLTLKDNGTGALDIQYGFGLTTMQNRARKLDGQLTISSEPGKGCRLSVRLPIVQTSK